MTTTSAARSFTATKTALVLAGGGSFGVVQVGMLRALCAHGVRPDLVAGSSVGAINGAFYAGDPSANGIERLAGLWRALRRRDVFPISLRRLLGALVSSDALFSPCALHKLLVRHLPHALLDDSVIPMHVVATDLLTGAPVRVSAGAAVEAVLASCAIPAIYPPVRIGGRQLVDGAVACNTPIRIAVELGATRLILLPTAFACPHAAPPRGAFASAFHAMDLVVMQQLAQDTELYARRAQIITVPPICPLAVPRYDFSRAGELIDIATHSTERWLEQGGLANGAPLVAADVQPRSESLETHQACAAQLPSCVGIRAA
jgi:NTE family protein